MVCEVRVLSAPLPRRSGPLALGVSLVMDHHRRACFRFSSATSRASASETSDAGPRPISVRLPRMTIRWTQRLAPLASTLRKRPCPSKYFPGCEVFLTCTALSAFSGWRPSLTDRSNASLLEVSAISSPIYCGIVPEHTGTFKTLFSNKHRVLSLIGTPRYGGLRTSSPPVNQNSFGSHCPAVNRRLGRSSVGRRCARVGPHEKFGPSPAPAIRHMRVFVPRQQQEPTQQFENRRGHLGGAIWERLAVLPGYAESVRAVQIGTPEDMVMHPPFTFIEDFSDWTNRLSQTDFLV